MSGSVKTIKDNINNLKSVSGSIPIAINYQNGYVNIVIITLSTGLSLLIH